MDFFSAAVLGALQGVTEFLPISSSGHLILFRDVFGLETSYSLGVDAVLHLATAGAVALYFWKDLLRLVRSAVGWLRGRGIDQIDKVLIAALTIGTAPAVLFGILLESYMETVFRSAQLVALALIVGSLVMIVGEWFAQRRQERPLSVLGGFGVGLFQTLALIPGMSRSGMAISGGLFFGLPREQAARFAFLLSLPLFFGSGMKKILELESAGVFATEGMTILIAAATAFVTGWMSIHFLLRFLRHHRLTPFIIYRLALAAVVLIF
jgi:undecaprenyl-diphosphatase